MKKIIIDVDGWCWLEEYDSEGELHEIGLGDIDVDVVIEDRRHEKPLD
jgi:hypothetical protein